MLLAYRNIGAYLCSICEELVTVHRGRVSIKVSPREELSFGIRREIFRRSEILTHR
jgi:hypothetical protein